MKEIIFSKDRYKMNWLRTDYPYAKADCPKELKCSVKNQKDGDIFHTSIQFTNQSRNPFFTSLDDIGIYFPLEDRYESSEICIPYRCHTHIFCGGNVSYIMALQMGGESPHFGMVLTEGSLEAYSIKRDLAKGSNDRGCFILHPSSMELEPGETKEINWMIFPHEGKDDFQKQLGNFCKYIKVEAERYVLFPGERNRICITPSFAARSVLVNGNQLSAAKNGQYQMEYTAKTCGEEVFSICVDGVHTWCRTFVQEEVGKLAENRCWFIVNHQQYEGRCPELRGAYLTYDNEEKHIFYNRTNDYNGGRERVGMGLLMAEFLL